MKLFIATLVCGVTCSLGTTAAADPSVAVGATRQITILHVNDSHGRYMPLEVTDENATSQTGDPGGPPERFERRGRVGGFAYLATAVDQIRRQRGRENVLLVHAGDTFSDDLLGNLTEGRAVIGLMNALEFDFMALGNHDFDYGQKQTRRLQEIARFPMRGANVIDTTTGKPFLGDPTTVFTVGGVRVGVLALSYHHTDFTTSPKNVPTLKFISGIATARRYVPDLASRSDVVIVVSHLGSAVDRKLAREVKGIDLIIGGHSHDTLAAGDKVGDTWIAQSLADLAVLGEATLIVRGHELENIEIANHVLWNDRYQPDAEFQRMITDLRRPHRERLEEVLATAVETIGRNYMSESPFDVLVGEMLRAKTGADVAMLPGIGYGVSLTPGPIIREELYTLLPHPAKVATVRLTGSQILEILQQSVTNIAPADPEQIVGGLVQTAGMAWTIDLTKPIGDRISDVTIDGNPLQPNRSYLVATQSGMLGGIHRYDTIGHGEDSRTRDQKLVDLVEEGLREMQEVRRPTLGTVRLIK